MYNFIETEREEKGREMRWRQKKGQRGPSGVDGWEMGGDKIMGGGGGGV